MGEALTIQSLDGPVDLEKELVNGTVAWANNAAAGSEGTGGPLALEVTGANPGHMLVVFVRNPSTETALTGQVKLAWTPSGLGEQMADLSLPGGRSTFTVLADNDPGGQAWLIDGGILAAGGQLSLKNNTLVGASGAFTAHVQVHAVSSF